MISLFGNNKGNTDSEQLLLIREMLDEREVRTSSNLEKYMNKEDTKLDKIIESFNYLKDELNTLSVTVASNHISAMNSITDRKHEIREEVSDKYVTKKELERITSEIYKNIEGNKKDAYSDLSKGLAAIRYNAKLVWSVVLFCFGTIVTLNKMGIL